MRASADFVLNQTMLRVKDPAASVAFYRDLLRMILLDCYDFPDMRFSLYFMGYPLTPAPEDRADRIRWVFDQPGLLELTHNWGTEDDTAVSYHNGNAEPRGFGHIGVGARRGRPVRRARRRRRDVHQAVRRGSHEGPRLYPGSGRLLDRDPFGREPPAAHHVQVGGRAEWMSRRRRRTGCSAAAPCARYSGCIQGAKPRSASGRRSSPHVTTKGSAPVAARPAVPAM